MFKLFALVALSVVPAVFAAPTVDSFVARAGGPSVYTIHPGNDTTKCVGILGGKYVNGAQVDIYDCNGSNTQKWQWYGNALTSVNTQDYKHWCLDAGNVSELKSGVKAKIWMCYDSLPQQKWSSAQYGLQGRAVESSPRVGQNATFVPPQNGTTSTNSTASSNSTNGTNGTFVPPRIPTNSTNGTNGTYVPPQNGTFVPPQNGTTVPPQNGAQPTQPFQRATPIKLSVGNKCLDLTNGSKTNRNVLQLWSCVGNANQQWSFAPA